MKDANTEVPLTLACRIAGKRYGWLYPRLLSGEVEGRQVEGRWLVNVGSVLRLREQSAKTEPAR